MPRVDLLQFPKIKREIGTRTDEHRVIARRFDREFFDGSRDTGYGGYRNDGRWVPVARRMIEYYGLQVGVRVLDVGCAKGYLVHALVHEGMDAYGMDISGYALADCPNKPHGFHKRLMLRDAANIPNRKYDLIVSINTLHNLDRSEIVPVLRHMQKISVNNYVTVDAFRNDEERERMMAWNLTARTILHIAEWEALFAQAGYTGDYDWFTP